MRAIGALLASQVDQFEVRALSPSLGSEMPMTNPRVLLAALGAKVETDARGAVGRGRPVLRYTAGGIRCSVLDTPATADEYWEFRHGEQFNRLYERLLEDYQPDIVFCAGGAPGDVFRRELAHLARAQVCMAVHSLGYLHKLAFEHTDNVLFPSRFLRDRYECSIGLAGTYLSTPVHTASANAVQPPRDPHSVLFLRPALSRGLAVVIGIAKSLAGRNSAITLTVGADLAGQALFRDFVRRHAGNAGLPALRAISDLSAGTGALAGKAAVLLAPSTDENGIALDVAEAMAAGAIPLVSDRGALPEVAVPSGSAELARSTVVPIPAATPARPTDLPTSAEIRPWIEALEHLTSDSAKSSKYAEGVRSAIADRVPCRLLDQYAAYFDQPVGSHPLSVAAGHPAP